MSSRSVRVVSLRSVPSLDQSLSLRPQFLLLHDSPVTSDLRVWVRVGSEACVWVRAGRGACVWVRAGRGACVWVRAGSGARVWVRVGREVSDVRGTAVGVRRSAES